MISVYIRNEGNEAIMTIPPEVIEKLNLTVGTRFHLEITHEGIKAYPTNSLFAKYLGYSRSSDRERQDLDKVAILSSN